MPTIQKVVVTPAKDPKRAKITLHFDFAVNDPRAQAYYIAIATCLRIAFNDQEAIEFLGKLAVHQDKFNKRKPRKAAKR